MDEPIKQPIAPGEWVEIERRRCPACDGELNVEWSPDSIDFLCNECGYGWFERTEESS